VRGGTFAAGELLTRDGQLILLSRSARGLTYGFVSVLLATYLEALGANEATIGVVLGLALLSGAGLNILAGRFADRLGRRRFLGLSGVLMFLSGIILAVTGSVEGAVLAAMMGALTPTAMEVGPFLSVEQAILPQVSPSDSRTRAYAWYNMLGSFAAAVGALLSGLASALTVALGGDPLAGIHAMFLWYALTGLGAAAISLGLSPAVEAPLAARGPERAALSPPARTAVNKLVLLFGIDSFAGGMIIRTFTAFWFTVRFQPTLETLGVVFFFANTLSALSYLGAARLAERLGLIRTMVYTHLPSNILLVVLPFSPTFEIAVAVFLGRLAIAQMDVAPRQEFVVSVVSAPERTAAASITNTSRNVTQAAGPFALGPVALLFGVGGPFVISGILKLAYDLLLLRTFGAAEAQADAESKPPG